jgi:Xaa-Pro aminopeptidase
MDYSERLAAALQGTREQGIDALLIAPGADLRYLTGYDATPLERLTCLVMTPNADAYLMVPELEELAALASPAGAAGLPVRTYRETDDPYAMIAQDMPAPALIAVDDRMWASKALTFQARFSRSAMVLAGSVLQPLRMKKSAAEIGFLREAATAIDHVHAQVPNFLAAGRTERDIAGDIGEAILAAGHVRVDFIIVGSGPNGASPHHDVSDRVVQQGDAIVVDIGGMMPSGYRSDCTRMYSIGEPSAEFLRAYATLETAQHEAVANVKPGQSCADLDAIPRSILAEAGLGDAFIHRTGHGIGLETHEEPYLVAGNELHVSPGMTFSIEPGVYHPGKFGMRIEDIVLVTESGVESLNQCPRHLVQVG